jgi:hypothetical protein
MFIWLPTNQVLQLAFNNKPERRRGAAVARRKDDEKISENKKDPDADS